MKTDLTELMASLKNHNQRAYTEFQRSADLSSGLYYLPAGANDPQQPHTEDEIYYIISGHGQIRLGDQDMPVGPGSFVFVEANIEHRFHSISEAMQILVVFGPAEYTRKQRAKG